jgi:hypothetical protein
MATTDIGEPSPRENQETSQVSNEVRSEVRQLLKSWAERTGFPIDELNRLRAKRRAAPSRIAASRAPVSAFVPDEEDLSFRHALEKERELLRSLSPPAAVIKLDHPQTIELVDQFPVRFFEQSIGPFLSFARLIVNVGDSPISDSPKIIATYKWNNNISKNFALINVGTLIRIRGSYEIDANTGIFDGNTNKLDVFAQFRIEIGGMPVFAGGNLFQTVVKDEASAGGSIFGHHNVHVTNTVGSAVGLGADTILVPAGADVSFFVDLTTSCRLDADAFIGDEIKVDFGNFTDSGLDRIQYPFLNVQVLAN